MLRFVRLQVCIPGTAAFCTGLVDATEEVRTFMVLMPLLN
jgi:hypothetical protein